MIYEVGWLTYEINWDLGIEEPCIYYEEYNTLEAAMDVYNQKKSDINVHSAKLLVVLDGYNQEEMNKDNM